MISMPGTCKGYTTPHRCATISDTRRNRPSERDYQARHKLQEKVSDFSVQFHSPIYFSIGPEAKRDIYNNFDPDRPVSIHLDPPSTGKPPVFILPTKNLQM